MHCHSGVGRNPYLNKDGNYQEFCFVSNFIVKKVAVLGAGVMGAQIAAHCINARVPVIL
ncbi:MAG: hypothetical protein KGN40_05920, partial [Burkholderiales bacterium]|nr:hypothetical protein [Burkholderiales bacterium]